MWSEPRMTYLIFVQQLKRNKVFSTWPFLWHVRAACAMPGSDVKTASKTISNAILRAHCHCQLVKPACDGVNMHGVYVLTVRNNTHQRRLKDLRDSRMTHSFVYDSSALIWLLKRCQWVKVVTLLLDVLLAAYEQLVCRETATSDIRPTDCHDTSRDSCHGNCRMHRESVIVPTDCI